ncbi:MAG TPA: 30S ribosomal protein S4e [Candidatus Deferrimicrobium sp.]|nr:30S ribosomal protein S4e [Candidatus Deferrimicrobium sp.]
MTHKGEKKHLKRTSALKYWSTPKKETKFTVKPSPGPHPALQCIPLLIIVRNLLHFADTAREAKRIISSGEIKIDGVVRKSLKYPVGLMDVLEIPKINKFYRIIAAPRRGLILHPIEEDEAQFKLCRIENKLVVNGGHIQLNLHDSRNILIKLKNPTAAVEDVYKTKDVLKLSIPSQDILEHIKFDENIHSMVIAGRHLGLYGKITKIEKRFGPHASTVSLEKNGKHFQTALEYAFPLGIEQSLISLPE